MKKLLLGSTALAAAGLMSASAMAAEPIKVSINGYYQWYFVLGGWDDNRIGPISGGVLPAKRDGRTDSIRQEGEIWFNGITKLDNGTNVGFRIELEAYEFGDQVDEHYLFFSGDWGRIEAGATNGVMSKMVYGAPSALPGFGFISQNFNWHSGYTTNTSFSTAIQDDRNVGDANKISYFTPRFAGFQIGVSYTPEFQPGTNGNVCGATGGSSTSFGACFKDNAGQWEHSIQVAANYLATFNSVNLALYGAVMYADPEVKGALLPIVASNNNIIGGQADDWWHWLVGINVTFQGFSIGGNVGRDNNGVKDAETWMYTLGMTYTSGPWTVGGGWRHYKRDLPGFKDDKTHQFELGGNYRIGPGIALAAGVVWNLVDGDKDLNGCFGGPVNACLDNRSDSWQFVLGTAITF
ncbi:MAG: porin [Reyranellaceae bacterium]